MKHFHVRPITLYCMVGFENYLAQMIIMTRQCVACKNLELSQLSICVSVFDLHGPSVVSPILLYYISLHLWTYNYPTKASTLIKALFYSRHKAGASVACGHISSLIQK